MNHNRILREIDCIDYHPLPSECYQSGVRLASVFCAGLIRVRRRTIIAGMFTTAYAAKSLRVAEYTVRRFCAAKGIGVRLGGSGPWVLTEADVAALKNVIRPTAGRPRKETIPPHPRRKRRKSIPANDLKSA